MAKYHKGSHRCTGISLFRNTNWLHCQFWRQTNPTWLKLVAFDAPTGWICMLSCKKNRTIRDGNAGDVSRKAAKINRLLSLTIRALPRIISKMRQPSNCFFYPSESFAEAKLIRSAGKRVDGRNYAVEYSETFFDHLNRSSASYVLHSKQRTTN